MATISTRPYDPKGVAKWVAIASCIRKYLHEENKFDDLFIEASYYNTILRSVDGKLSVKERE